MSKKIKCCHCGIELKENEYFEEEIDYSEVRKICAICWWKLNS